MTALLVGLVLAGTQSSYRGEYPLPSLTVPSGWGVNIHFNKADERLKARLRESGLKWVRKDLYWDQIETKRGELDFHRFDRLMGILQEVGMRPILILNYGNKLYGDGPPRGREARAAFLRYVEAAVKRYRGKGVLWEMWNEPNLAQFWSPKENPDEYVSLAKAVGQTIRRIAPEEWFIGPATSGRDWDYLEDLLQRGVLEYFDAVSIHPYRSGAPETALADWARLRALVGRYKPRGKQIGLISGEWGYSEVVPGMSRQLQNVYAPRTYLTNMMAGVPLTIWYDWEDHRPNSQDKEHRFGLLDFGGSPKGAFQQVSKLARELNGYRHIGVLPMSVGDFLMVFQKGQARKYVAWTSGKPHRVQLPIPSRISMTLTGQPVVVQ